MTLLLRLQTFYSNLCAFLFLELLMICAAMNLEAIVDESSKPLLWFISPPVPETYVIGMRRNHQFMLLEATFYSVIAFYGYYIVLGSRPGARSGHRRTFVQIVRDLVVKYSWLCIVPWLIHFYGHCVGEMLVLLATFVTMANGADYSLVLLLAVYYVVLALVGSEVICVSLYGCKTMLRNERRAVR